MRSRVPLLALLFAVGSFALPLAAHAAVPFFGPIIPSGNNLCPAGWGMLMIVINNIISLLLTLAIVFVAPIMIAYSGFLFVVNPVNPGGKEKAKGILLNTVVGIVIALAGWFIVDAVMAVLYNPGTPVAGGTLGVWSSLVTSSGPQCLPQAGSLPTDTLNQAVLSGISANGGVITINGQPTSQCSRSNTACSPDALQAAGFTLAQANAMSCIAVTESSGNPNTPNSSTGACGTFQITRGNWNTASLHQSPCSSATSCNDPACNLQTAYLLSQQNVVTGKSPYQPWTCPGCNANAQACVNQYDPGH